VTAEPTTNPQFPTESTSAAPATPGTPGTPGTRAIRLLIADDQALVRSGLRMLVDSTDDPEIVGEVGPGAAAVAMAR